ncbi:MAG: Maf family protein, partial [Microthrixaceae bacterium]|nr:Maf family protein [Microthrixaceae bacterium]
MDKAGAYALQGQGAALVESIEGDPTTVIGLPLRPTIDALRALGLPPPAFTSDRP